MAQELKIHLTDYQTVEDKLRSLGAQFVEETTFTDTYFNQPAGEVFKVADTSKGYFLLQLKKTSEGTFSIDKNNPIEHADQVIAEMTNEYGVKSVLTGKRKTFSLAGMTVTINLINQRGAFLIVTGDNPTEDFVTDKLSMPNPEYIRVSFDELPQTDFTVPEQ
ncbi:MAG TPA: hypothetical protein VE090_04285 [Methylomirabilota bacterium]|nr:hypothetical protein [Methylomirabilota bacterium]